MERACLLLNGNEVMVSDHGCSLLWIGGEALQGGQCCNCKRRDLLCCKVEMYKWRDTEMRTWYLDVP